VSERDVMDGEEVQRGQEQGKPVRRTRGRVGMGGGELVGMERGRERRERRTNRELEECRLDVLLWFGRKSRGTSSPVDRNRINRGGRVSESDEGKGERKRSRDASIPLSSSSISSTNEAYGSLRESEIEVGDNI